MGAQTKQKYSNTVEERVTLV